jgi:methylated-DNA-[protein]-cysteine S-methyltransferase
MAMLLETARLDFPLGGLRLARRDQVVVAVGFDDRWDAVRRDLERHAGPCRFAPGDGGEPARHLEAYLAGELDAIDTIEVELWGSPFQRQVWTALRTIPAGTTISYRELAVRIGRPRAVRAVGAANGANPIAIVVPCHRVIGAGGALTGYGGGLDRKRWLLAHESHRAAQPSLPLARLSE